MREYTVTLSSKGQLTLPAEIRRELDLDQGARLRLIVHDDGIVELAKPRFSHIAEVAGIGKGAAVASSPAEARETAHVERWLTKQERSR